MITNILLGYIAFLLTIQLFRSDAFMTNVNDKLSGIYSFLSQIRHNTEK